MSFEARRTTQGFEFAYNLIGKGQGNPEFIRKYPSLKNVAFTRGDAVFYTKGQVDLLDSVDGTSVLGVVEKTQAAVTYGAGLLPVRINPDAVYVCSISGINEETVATAGATAQEQAYFTVDTGLGTNDYNEGAYLVVYDGADKGSVYVIDNYVHAGKTVTVDRPHNIDTTSKLYILGLLNSDAPIGPGTEIDIVSGSPSSLDGDADPAGGPFTVVELTEKDALDGTIHVKVSATHHVFDRAIT